MIGFEPRTVARDAALRALRLVQADGNHFKPTDRYRPRLHSARDLLDIACRKFEKDMYLDEHEHFYLPLFDALTLCNVACTKREVRRKDLRELRVLLGRIIAAIEQETAQAVNQ